MVVLFFFHVVFTPGSPTKKRTWLWFICTVLHWAFHRRGSWTTEEERFKHGNSFEFFFCMKSYNQAMDVFVMMHFNLQFGKKWFTPEEASSLRVKIHNLLKEEFQKSCKSMSSAECVNVDNNSWPSLGSLHWDPHSLDEQSVHNVHCWLFGVQTIEYPMNLKGKSSW